MTPYARKPNWFWFFSSGTSVVRRIWIYSSIGATAFVAWIAAPPSASSPAPKSGVSGVSLASKSPPQNFPKPLPADIERPALELASRDPFAMVTAPAPVITTPKPVQVAPPPPSPPPLNLQFTGRMTGPDGKQVIFVALGDTTLSLSVGQTLPNGYRVNAIHERSVELSYLPLNFNTRLDLPAPPTYEIR
jgi:hypothetical protein